MNVALNLPIILAIAIAAVVILPRIGENKSVKLAPTTLLIILVAIVFLLAIGFYPPAAQMIAGIGR